MFSHLDTNVPDTNVQIPQPDNPHTSTLAIEHNLTGTSRHEHETHSALPVSNSSQRPIGEAVGHSTGNEKQCERTSSNSSAAQNYVYGQPTNKGTDANLPPSSQVKSSPGAEGNKELSTSLASTSSASGKLEIRKYKLPKSSAPKFVPRQLNKPIAQTKGSRHITLDKVHADLKRDALVLGDVTGPMLLDSEELKRKRFKASSTGDPSLEETYKTIRSKVTEVCHVDFQNYNIFYYCTGFENCLLYSSGQKINLPISALIQFSEKR